MADDRSELEARIVHLENVVAVCCNGKRDVRPVGHWTIAATARRMHGYSLSPYGPPIKATGVRFRPVTVIEAVLRPRRDRDSRANALSLRE
jgi:hypothetical protein